MLWPMTACFSAGLRFCPRIISVTLYCLASYTAWRFTYQVCSTPVEKRPFSLVTERMPDSSDLERSEDKVSQSEESNGTDSYYEASTSSSHTSTSTSTSCDTSAESLKVKSSNWTGEQKLTAVAMATMNFATQVSFAVIAPFFPVEAGHKGATAIEIGLIFGIFQLIIFLTAPIYGKYINALGAKCMFLSGSVLCGACNIVFGFLDEINSQKFYVIACFLCRVFEANGASMLTTASFAIMAKKFPKNVGSALGLLKTFSGIGMALGPTIGGGLYAVGGFKAPFIVVGSIVLLASFISMFVLPKIDGVTVISNSFFGLLKSPGCVIIYLVTIGSSMALSATDPIFSPFMTEKFGLNAGQIGLVFMTSPAVYALAAPFCGWVSDKGWYGSCVVIGCFLNGLSFLLQGPSPLLQWLIPLSLFEMILALGILGISVGFVLIPVFPMVIDLASSRGYPENLQTYGLISGYFNSASALGAFIGPTASSYFCEKYGFEWSTSICGFIIMILGVILVVYILIMRSLGQWPIQRNCQVTADEKKPLLIASP